MKLNIQITKETGDIYEGEKIIDIDINNGHWKYWDIYSQTTEKTTLTLNNFYEATFLTQPVKDAITHFDENEWEKNKKLIIDDAYVRTYDTLMDYLNCRICNIKEMNKKEMTLFITLFKQEYVKSNECSVIEDITYKQYGLLKVEIKKVE